VATPNYRLDNRKSKISNQNSLEFTMHTWHWQTWNGLPYLTCSLLEQWPHGFFTNQFWPRSPQELVGALRPTARVYRVKQVHGNTVLATGTLTPVSEGALESGEAEELAGNSDSSAAGEAFSQADGLVTERALEAVWVASADCTPVLIADSQTGQVAAVHSGWRGTARQIVREAIAKLQQQGSQLENLRVAMGPAISGEVYQVSLEVAAEVGATVVPNGQAGDAAAILEILQQLAPAPPVLADPEPGRVRLDVRRAIALQLEQLGIASERIACAPHCTYQSPEHFFSYRRDSQKKVQWSGIVSI
jgi:YfiH family protein